MSHTPAYSRLADTSNDDADPVDASPQVHSDVQTRIKRKPLPATITYTELEHDDRVSWEPGEDRINDPETPGRSRHENHTTSLDETRPIPDQQRQQTRDEHRCDRDDTKHPHTAFLRQPLWTNTLVWTHPIILLNFCVLFILMIAVIVALAVLSHAHQGFTVPGFGNPYTWKYGPTVILTTVVALWRQVDLYTRRQAPWLEMQRGYRPAGVSILLDYVSPILPVALLSAIKNKHWRVAATMYTYTLLKIILTVSTGLLLVQTTTRTRLVEDVTLQAQSGNTDTAYMGTTLTRQVYGNLIAGLPFRQGTTENTVFQTLSLHNNFPPSALVQVNVRAFYSSLQCEEMRIEIEHEDDFHHTPKFSSNTCSGTLNFYAEGAFFWPDCLTNVSKCPAGLFSSGTGNVVCKETGDARQAFLLVEAVPPVATGKNATVSWYTGTVCAANYSIETAPIEVQIGQNGQVARNTLLPALSHASAQLPYYAPDSLLNDTSRLYDLGLPESDADYNDPDRFGGNNFFSFMMAEYGTDDVRVFRDLQLMQEYANRTFQRLAAQWVGSWLTFPDHLITNATIIYSSDRLRVQNWATITMCVLLAIAAYLCGILAWTATTNNCLVLIPRSLSCICYLGQRGKSIAKTLGKCGHLSELRFRSRLSKLDCTISLDKLDITDLQCKSRQATGPASSGDQDILGLNGPPYWVPLSARMWFAGLAISLSIVQVIVLEVLQRLSDSHTHPGICDVKTSIETSSLIASLLSASLVLTTATMFNALEWAIGVFTPYVAMKKGSSSFARLNHDCADQLSPFAIFKTIRQRQYPICIIAISTLLGSVLTIVVSGLYTFSAVPSAHDITPQTISFFDTSLAGINSRTLDIIFDLVIGHNLSYPAGTYGEFAFPFVQLPLWDEVQHAVGHVDPVNSTLEIAIPALRGSLECSIVPQDNITIEHSTNPYYFRSGLEAVMDLPPSCQYSSGIFSNSSQIGFSYLFSTPVGTTATKAFIPFVDGAAFDDVEVPAACPSIGFCVGNFSINSTAANVTCVICMQVQEQVDTIVNLDLSAVSLASNPVELSGQNFVLDSNNPPYFDEVSAKVVSRYQYNFAALFKADGDEFFPVIEQHFGISVASLQGTGNEHKFIEAVQKPYRLFMAQQFNYASRLFSNQDRMNHTAESGHGDLDALPLDSNLNATLSSINRIRLFQNRVSKIILQSLLGAMTLCLIVAYSMTNVKDVLYHNPCSIAGKLSLVVGSQIADDIGRIVTATSSGQGQGECLVGRNGSHGGCRVKEDGQADEEHLVEKRLPVLLRLPDLNDKDEFPSEVRNRRLKLRWRHDGSGFGIDLL